jgi:hypothetical protein
MAQKFLAGSLPLTMPGQTPAQADDPALGAALLEVHALGPNQPTAAARALTDARELFCLRG